MKIPAICFACAILASAAADEPGANPAPQKAVERTFERSAVPGQSKRIDFWYALKIDCTTGPVGVEVAMRPEHGTVTIVDVQDSPRLASDSPGANCNKEKISGKAVMYQSKPGYSGSDSVVVEATYPGRIVYRSTYLIDVSDDSRVVNFPPPRPPASALPTKKRDDAAAKSLGPYEFDCDAPEGNFAHWSGPLPPGRAVITGTARMLATRKHEAYVPMGAIELYDSSPEISVALAFVAYPQKAGKVDAEIKVGTKPSAPPRRIALASLPAADKIPFTLRFEAGALEVSVGSASRRVNVDFVVPTRISLSCSTGEFLFENVTVTD